MKSLKESLLNEGIKITKTKKFVTKYPSGYYYEPAEITIGYVKGAGYEFYGAEEEGLDNYDTIDFSMEFDDDSWDCDFTFEEAKKLAYYFNNAEKAPIDEWGVMDPVEDSSLTIYRFYDPAKDKDECEGCPDEKCLEIQMWNDGPGTSEYVYLTLDECKAIAKYILKLIK